MKRGRERRTLVPVNLAGTGLLRDFKVLMGGVVRKLKTLMAAIGMAGSAACLAGPFCVVSGLGQNCRYFDEESCARAAVAQRGACIDKSTPVAPGINQHSRYCLVGVGENKCYYYDAASCAKAAQDQGGTCLQRPGSKD